MNNEKSISYDDQMFFLSDDHEPVSKRSLKKPWKIIIADDEKEVHKITHLVLEGYLFEGRPLTFLSAYSGSEAKALMEKNPDTAIILLDVVMETDDAGLVVTKYIRDELKNNFVRIILRTGQPGKAPEKQVIMDYDINSYKHKAELTAQSLFITITSSLRTYKDLMIIERSRRGLADIISSSVSLFEIQSLSNFAKGTLRQLYMVLQEPESIDGFMALCEHNKLYLLAGTGRYHSLESESVCEVLPTDVLQAIEIARIEKKSFYADSMYVIHFNTQNGMDCVAYLQGVDELSQIDKELINIFSINVSIALDNFLLNQEILDTQREVIFTLGEVVENHSRETANHIRRVSTFAHMLAKKAGLSDREADIIHLAAPMHDVGKIGIPDDILKKPGRLTPEEFEIMKTHSEIGYGILKKSKREFMKAAAIIAHEHHEKWDGTGYPLQLKGEEIHLYGRIIGLVDVFDALGHKRVYKEAWSLDRIVALLTCERGKHFDPNLVDIFLENIEEFVAVGDQYPD